MYFMTRTNEFIIFDILSFTVAKIKTLRKNYIDYKYHIQLNMRSNMKKQILFYLKKKNDFSCCFESKLIFDCELYGTS